MVGTCSPAFRLPGTLSGVLAGRWWRTVQAPQSEAGTTPAHVRKYWTRHIDFAVETRQGDSEHDWALDRTRWAASRADYVASCTSAGGEKTPGRGEAIPCGASVTDGPFGIVAERLVGSAQPPALSPPKVVEYEPNRIYTDRACVSFDDGRVRRAGIDTGV